MSVVDNESDKKFRLKEIVDMLVVGGYFRARLPALTPFDRVVGGMAWALTASNVDADVDVVFEENSTIGQKIKMSDSIVKALIKLKCPHALQSHQIQGLDLDKCFPVIQWLIKKVVETRLVTGDLVRQYAVSQFSKHYVKFPHEGQPDAARQFCDQAAAAYEPKRKFRKQEDGDYKSPESHVEATLLEYGQRIFSSAVVDLHSTSEDGAGTNKTKSAASALAAKLGMGDTKKGKKTAEEEAADKANQEAEEQMRMERVAAELAAVEGDARLSRAQIGKIVGLQADAIREASDAYADEMSLLDTSGAGSGAVGAARSAEQQHNRQLEALRRQDAAAQEKHAEVAAVHETESARLQGKRDKIEEMETFANRLVSETAKLDELEAGFTDEQKAALKKLKALVALNEQFKKQEKKFKDACKEQLAQLQEAIKKLDESDGTGVEDAEIARLREIESIYEADLDKHAKLRQVLARKNQEIAAVVRAIDDIPTRAELLQYERRFVELYQLVAEKLKETRKYFALYNTLDDTRTYLSREVALIESIQKGYVPSMKTPAGKEALLTQFKQILDGVAKTADKVSGDLTYEKETLEKSGTNLNSLVDQQRAYFKTVKQFQDECVKNEQLMQLMQEAEQAAAESVPEDE